MEKIVIRDEFIKLGQLLKLANLVESGAMAKEVIDLGLYIGIGGAVTFKNAKKPAAVVQFLPEDRLLLEIQSKNTYENILYSDALISRILAEEKRGRSRAAKKAPEGSSFIQAEGLPVRVAILSADYHLFRALHLAEKMTGGEYCGIAAKSDPVMFAHFVTRECIAIVKDKFFGRL